LTVLALSGSTALACLVTGKIACGNGLVFPGVTITITDAANNIAGTAQAGATGMYSIDLAQGGTYTASLSNLPSGITSAAWSTTLGGGATGTGTSVTGFIPDGTVSLTLDWTLDGPACSSPGTGTPGYWGKTGRVWPVSTITVGGIVYSKSQAQAMIQSSVSGDKRYTMFPELVSAKLNVIIGNDASCIQGTIDAADQWWALYHGSPVAGNSAAWAVGGPLSSMLDAYNNGLLCAPHRN